MPTPALPLRLVAAGLLAASTFLHAETPAKPVPASVLKRYDKNKNGTLEAAEAAKWEADKAAVRAKRKGERDALLAKYDANQDGRLDEAEAAEAKLGMEKERAEREGEKIMARAAAEKAAQQAAAVDSGAKNPAPVAPSAAPSPDKTTAPAMTEGSDMMMMQ